MDFRFLLIAFFLVSGTVFAGGMNLNELTPTMLEDATPVDEKAHVLLLSTTFDKTDQDEVLFQYLYN